MVKTPFQSAGLRRLLVGSAGAYLGLWAFTVLFAIYAYDEGGAAAVGVAALLRQLPAGLLAPWIAVFADRRARRQVLLLSGAMQSVLVAAAGAIVALDGPFAVVVALAAVMTVAAAPFRPAHFALIPQLAGTPTQIAAANVVWGGVEYAGFLGGRSPPPAWSPRSAWARRCRCARCRWRWRWRWGRSCSWRCRPSASQTTQARPRPRGRSSRPGSGARLRAAARTGHVRAAPDRDAGDAGVTLDVRGGSARGHPHAPG